MYFPSTIVSNTQSKLSAVFLYVLCKEVVIYIPEYLVTSGGYGSGGLGGREGLKTLIRLNKFVYYKPGFIKPG